jgi:hypothetical protein
MDVCVRLFCVCVALCAGSGLGYDRSPSKESHLLCTRIITSESILNRTDYTTYFVKAAAAVVVVVVVIVVVVVVAIVVIVAEQ